MKKQYIFAIVAAAFILYFLAKGFSNGNPVDGFMKQIEKTKASGRAH